LNPIQRLYCHGSASALDWGSLAGRLKVWVFKIGRTTRASAIFSVNRWDLRAQRGQQSNKTV